MVNVMGNEFSLLFQCFNEGRMRYKVITIAINRAKYVYMRFHSHTHVLVCRSDNPCCRVEFLVRI